MEVSEWFSRLTAVLAEAPHDIIFYFKMRAWPDLIQMTGTFLLTLFFSLEVTYDTSPRS